MTSFKVIRVVVKSKVKYQLKWWWQLVKGSDGKEKDRQ